MRINCGGFELNENDFELNGETLSLKNGGGSGGFAFVQEVSDGGTLTITTKAGELYSMCESGLVFARRTGGGGVSCNLIDTAFIDGDNYYHFDANAYNFIAETADDYPVYTFN